MGFFKGLKERAARIFSRPETPRTEQRTGSGASSGWFQRRREAREERKRQREYKKSQRRQEKLDREREEYELKKAAEEKKRREDEERAKKEADKRKREEQDAKTRKTFNDRWGFDDQEYDGFIQFISGFGDDMKEFITSESLVEIYRTGRNYSINPSDMRNIIYETYNSMSGGFTTEDLVDEIYVNIQGYAQNVAEGAFI